MHYVQRNKLFYVSKTSLDNRPVFYYISRLVSTVALDPASILFCLVAETKNFSASPLDLVIDLTMFGDENEWSLDMINSLDKVLPADGKANIHSMILINANSDFKIASKRYSKLVNPKAARKIEFVNSMEELHGFISPANIDLPVHTLAALNHSGTIFTPVNQIVNKRKDASVTVSVSQDLLQLTHVKKQEILGFSCTVTDFYLIEHISDIKISSDSKTSQLSIQITTPGRKRIEVSMSTPQRDNIYQLLKSMVSRARLINFKSSSEERILSPEDLPGTLLNIAFANVCSVHGALRASGYNLLNAIQASRNEQEGFVKNLAICIIS